MRRHRPEADLRSRAEKVSILTVAVVNGNPVILSVEDCCIGPSYELPSATNWWGLNALFLISDGED